MKKFLIRRAMEGASSVPKHEMNKGGKASEKILDEMRNEGKICLLYTSDRCRRLLTCRSRWSPYH